MKLFSFTAEDIAESGAALGIIYEGEYFHVKAFEEQCDPVKHLLESSNNDLDTMNLVIKNAVKEKIDPERITFHPPVLTSQKVICIGLNYKEHATELGKEIPEKPIVFSKFPTALAGHRRDVPLPKTSNKVDYEGELAVYIGKRGKRISHDAAREYIAGYSIFNDVSARDFQFGDGQWQRGKSCDGFAPVGAFLVTPDDVPNPHELALRTYVNSELRQESTTAHLIFDIPTLIEFISQEITLLPGDVIATGTPPGVGAFHDPPQFLNHGDTVTITIDNIGELRNTFV